MNLLSPSTVLKQVNILIMRRNPEKISAGGAAMLWLGILNAIVLEQGWVSNPNWYWLLIFTIPLLFFSIAAFRRRKL
jgi:hypothetical protein